MAHHEHDDWESRYAGVERLWSGRPNTILTELATHWSPGRCLDLGCGEGADALWLAERGWYVTGVDLSATAVTRMEAEASARGVGERVRGAVLDLAADPLPEGPFDLVTSFFLHGADEPGSRWLGEVLGRAAERVGPGGRLLAVTHCANPPWLDRRARTYTPEELRTESGPVVAAWSVEASAERWREVTGPDGQPGRRSDAVVCLRRPVATGSDGAPDPCSSS